MGRGDLNFLVAQEDVFQPHRVNNLLTNLGATKIVEATDSPAALTQLQDRSQQIDLGCIDLNMPTMDGMEMNRRMAKTGRTTAIAMSGVSDPAMEFAVVPLSKGTALTCWVWSSDLSQKISWRR